MIDTSYETAWQTAISYEPDLCSFLKDYAFSITPETSAAALDKMLSEYNWDDGFGIPFLILLHPNCALATAVSAFWLVEGRLYFERTPQKGILYNDGGWYDFVHLLCSAALEGKFPQNGIPFPEEYRPNRRILNLQKKHGKVTVPDLFFGLGLPWESEEATL